MIMIRPNATQKVGKPPPPVPPRPSKSVVAEALAKSRHNNKVDVTREAVKTKSPARQAPPPPTSAVNEVVKSKSSYSVNVVLKKPAAYERSISEEVKNNSRPVIYQSTNVKCTTNSNNNKVQITRKDSELKIVNRVESFHNKDCVQIVRKDSVKKIDSKNRVQVSRKDSVKRDSFCGDKCEKYVEVEGTRREIIERNCVQNEANDQKSKSNASTLEKSCNSSEINTESSSTHSSLDQKNWDTMLNDRNHVNTLIDEMFASVLEVHFTDDNSSQTNNEIVTSQTNGLSQDTTKITVNNPEETDRENIKIENSVNVISHDCHENGKAEENHVPTTVIVIKSDSSDVEDQRDSRKDTDCTNSSSNSVERSKQVKFKDQINHELLINELQGMKLDQDKILKRQRKPSMNIYEHSVVPNSDNASKVQRPGWLDVGSGGQDLKISTCQITIDGVGDREEKKGLNLDYERITKMSSLHGLPPLPKSLSGFNLLDNHNHQSVSNPPTPMRSSSMRSAGQQIPPGHLVYPPHPKVNGGGPDMNIPQLGVTSGRKSTGLDTQLAILRREMYSLRQLDLSLLSQLWSLNESIQDFRQILQDQEDRVLSPPSPSPTPSSGEDMDGDEFYMSASSMNFRPAPPPPPVARRPSSSSNASSLG